MEGVDGQTARALEEGSEITCRPFLKWAGGKGQLLGELLARMPADFGTYFEPFLGGGALFFAAQPKQAYLSDLNSDLINTFTVVRDQIDDLVQHLARHTYEKEYFYKLREADRGAEYQGWSGVERASRLIYLNKTCYNGLYRVNSKGYFNVPFGRYNDPTILDEQNLRACSAALQGARLPCHSFEVVGEVAEHGDFVYLDPPYQPMSETSDFTGYVRGGFGEEEHRRLRDLCVKLDKRGAKFMLSNSVTPFTEELYQDFRVERVTAQRAINSKGDRRGKIEELIVRNYL